MSNNKLAITHPKPSREWSGKNKFSPEGVTFGSSKKVWWKCKKGHEWEATPNSRTGRGNPGCPHCSASVSEISQKWLDLLKIPKKYREARLKINGKTFCTDAYVPETNTVYEFNGDFWHGNPKIHNQK